MASYSLSCDHPRFCRMAAGVSVGHRDNFPVRGRISRGLPRRADRGAQQGHPMIWAISLAILVETPDALRSSSANISASGRSWLPRSRNCRGQGYGLCPTIPKPPARMPKKESRLRPMTPSRARRQPCSARAVSGPFAQPMRSEIRHGANPIRWAHGQDSKTKCPPCRAADFFFEREILTLTTRSRRQNRDVGADGFRDRVKAAVSFPCRHCRSTPRICRPPSAGQVSGGRRSEETPERRHIVSLHMKANDE